MAMADTILFRWDSVSGRLPDNLAGLRGPRDGIVVLPVHLTWHGLREFDVSEAGPRQVLYSIVLSQGRKGDLARFVNAQRLAEDWPALRALLSRRTRRACERRLGLSAAALHPAGAENRVGACANT